MTKFPCGKVVKPAFQLVQHGKQQDSLLHCSNGLYSIATSANFPETLRSIAQPSNPRTNSPSTHPSIAVTMKRSTSVREKLKAHIRKVEERLRKKPSVSSEQKLQCRIDTLTTQARELHAEGDSLRAQAATFNSRAKTTLPPEAPPADRDAIFQRDGKAPPSWYDAQVRARDLLLDEWRRYEDDVKAHGKKLDRFVAILESVKKGQVKPDSPMGQVEHQFEGLDNAVFNLREQRVELSQAVAAVPLPGGTEK